jgi:hypothetical protein
MDLKETGHENVSRIIVVQDQVQHGGTVTESLGTDIRVVARVCSILEFKVLQP